MLSSTAKQLRAASLSGALDSVRIMHTLLGRPNVNVGGPDYITDLPPMVRADKRVYADVCMLVVMMNADVSVLVRADAEMRAELADSVLVLIL